MDKSKNAMRKPLNLPQIVGDKVINRGQVARLNLTAVGIDDWFGDAFAPRSFAEPVDDVVIGYDIPETLDGPGGKLGPAGAVFVRRDATTISGVMRFDGADLEGMSTTDIRAIILHEMCHVLGLVGTTRMQCTSACDTEAPREQSVYSCPVASNEYSQITRGLGEDLELEKQGGMGTACGHWEEDIFRTQSSSEVMTGFFEANLFQPLSSVTVAALEDIGYEVDYCGADIWPATFRRNDQTIRNIQGLWITPRERQNSVPREPKVGCER